MRTIEDQRLALECIKLAYSHEDGGSAILLAREFYAFVTGSDEQCAVDKLEAVRNAVA